MMGWKNSSGQDCFAFVPLSPVEAARQKTGLEDWNFARGAVRQQGHTTEDTGSQGDGMVPGRPL